MFPTHFAMAATLLLLAAPAVKIVPNLLEENLTLMKESNNVGVKEEEINAIRVQTLQSAAVN